jgi:hypothetical protein
MTEKQKLIRELFYKNALCIRKKLKPFDYFTDHNDYNDYIKYMKNDAFIELGRAFSKNYSENITIDNEGCFEIKLVVLNEQQLEDLVNTVLLKKRLGLIE